jgi:hypothetical protein
MTHTVFSAFLSAGKATRGKIYRRRLKRERYHTQVNKEKSKLADNNKFISKKLNP